MSIQENPFLVLQKEIADLRETVKLLITYIHDKESLVTVDKSEYGGVDLAMEMTQLSRPTIYRKVRESSIPYSKIGRRLIFSRTDLTNWIESNKFETENNIYNQLGTTQKSRLGRKI